MQRDRAALEDRDLDPVLVVEPLLEIRGASSGRRSVDHLSVEVSESGVSGSSPSSLRGAPRELVTAVAHGVPIVLVAATRSRPER